MSLGIARTQKGTHEPIKSNSSNLLEKQLVLTFSAGLDAPRILGNPNVLASVRSVNGFALDHKFEMVHILDQALGGILFLSFFQHKIIISCQFIMLSAQ